MLMIKDFFLSFAGLFVFFVFIILLKESIIRNRWESNSIAKLIFYPVALVFVLCDAAFNVFYASWMFLERANKHGEGWLLTSRLKWHIKQGKEAAKMWKRPSWRSRLAAFLCKRFLHPVDKGHCE